MPYYPPPTAPTTFATPAATTPGARSAPGVATTAIRSDAGIQSPGGIASLSASKAIANTETQVLGFSVPANFCLIGTTFRIRVAGVQTTGVTPGTAIFRIRFGTTTLLGNIPTQVSPVNIASLTNAPFVFEALVTVRTIGAGGTVIGECWVGGIPETGGTTTFSNGSLNGHIIGSTTTATVALDTTAVKILELTYISGNAGTTATFHVGLISVEKM